MIESDAAQPGAEEISSWFQKYIAKVAAIPADEVDVGADFDSFGLDSVQGVDMITALEDWLGLEDDLPIEIISTPPASPMRPMPRRPCFPKGGRSGEPLAARGARRLGRGDSPSL